MSVRVTDLFCAPVIFSSEKFRVYIAVNVPTLVKLSAAANVWLVPAAICSEPAEAPRFVVNAELFPEGVKPSKSMLAVEPTVPFRSNTLKFKLGVLLPIAMFPKSSVLDVNNDGDVNEGVM